MAACSHGADYDSCPPKKVAKEFNKADKGTGILKTSFKEWLDIKESVESIAKKHGVSSSSIEQQIKMGIEVEHEHTDDDNEARKIALDHLKEKPNYYTALAKMEKGECDK